MLTPNERSRETSMHLNPIGSDPDPKKNTENSGFLDISHHLQNRIQKKPK